MKSIERITLMTLAGVSAGYLIRQAVRNTRAERLFRLAAGESNYERTHPKPRRGGNPAKPSLAASQFLS
ncbi:MAG: hypothetical protein WCP45_06290 [Verrucomicrobiota bacterium]